MFDTMYAARGIGLAAIQVDIPLRMIVIDVSEHHDEPLCLINPEILWREGEEEMDEGCLSVPGFWEPVSGRTGRVQPRTAGQPFDLETMVCWRSASSTKSTTWMANSSSIIFPP